MALGHKDAQRAFNTIRLQIVCMLERIPGPAWAVTAVVALTKRVKL